jgi:cytochrome c biogenesis protein CcdA
VIEMDLGRLSLVFYSGVLAILSPCALPMLPSYVALYLNFDNNKNKLYSALIFGFITVAGFLTVFLGIGLIPSYALNLLSKNSKMINVIIGLLLIIIGLLTGWTNIMYRLPAIGFSSNKKGIRGFFLYGLGYGLASLTCSLPIFLLLVLQSISYPSFSDVLISFIVYGIGAATVFIPLTLAIVYSKEILYKRLLIIIPKIKMLSGLILIIGGIYMIIYSL